MTDHDQMRQVAIGRGRELGYERPEHAWFEAIHDRP